MYNDLGGSDGHFVVRNLVIGAAYMVYGSGALWIALETKTSEAYTMSTTGYAWSLVIGVVIFTTMQFQDLKDQGDRSRNRHIAPMVLGHETARWTVAIPVVLWSVFCSMFWNFEIWISATLLTLGLVVAVRVVCLRCVSDDKKT
jgi:1,4-dihydroxy-2-naphthoate octaprenyltransferase